MLPTSLLLSFAAVAALAIVVALKRRTWPATIAAIVCVALPGAFVASQFGALQESEKRRRADAEERQSARHYFGDQPALLAVAEAVVADDPGAIRTTAQAVPDLQAPGRDGTTLLYFAVTRTWQRPEAAAGVKALLAAGADPNHTNGQSNSLALAAAVHGPVEVLRALLDAGGNPNARDEFGRPIIFNIWQLGHYPDQQRRRLQLLVERGADVDATLPAADKQFAAYPLLLYRTAMGREDERAYSDALYLLGRGADPRRAAADGMTFQRFIAQERDRLGRRRMRRQQKHSYRRPQGLDLACCVDTFARLGRRHRHIDHGDVDRDLVELGDELLPGPSRNHHLGSEIRQRTGQRLPEDAGVVGQGNPHPVTSRTGRVMRTVVPRSTSLEIVRLPRIAFTLSSAP